MSIIPGGTPGNAGFAGGYQASPHGGLPTSENTNAPVAVDTRARNALVLGVLGIVPFGILTGIPAIVVGAHSLRRIDASEGALEGRGLAWTGIVLGCISVLLFGVLLYLAYR
jgi:hypothetical protein